MAKSKSFFGLRTGSTKSLTFQVYRGQQITKDRVTRISNPRSEAQMRQRALIPIVAASRAALKGLVDHSFEGVAYGDASLKKFSELNLRAGALSVTSYSPNGVSNSGFADLIVSNGTINVPYTIGSDGTHNVVKSVTVPPFAFPAAEKGASAQAIFEYLEDYGRTNSVSIFTPGTQLTFLTIYQSGVVKVGTIDAATSGFAIGRIYIPKGDSDSKYAKEINDKWKVSEAVEKDAHSIILENSNGDKLTIATIASSALSLAYSTVEGVMNKNNCGMAFILSRLENGVWKRSTSRLTIGYEPSNKYTFEDWLSNYPATGAASKKYLNTGDESTGIRS